jgi:uncharacterized protein
MELAPGIIADRTALWLPQHSILSFADLHLGYEEELYHKGVHLPLNEFTYQRNLFGKLIGKYKPKTVVLNGDIKHSFGRINSSEWRQTKELFNLIAEHCDIVIIRGNHDTMLDFITTKHKLVVVDHYKSGDVLFLHGDVLPTTEMLEGIQTVIIGHEHPAISLTNGVRTEQYKCFLTLPWNKKTLIVQPSTFSLTHGTDVLSKKFLSPFLTNVSRAEVAIVGEETILPFGRLNRI